MKDLKDTCRVAVVQCAPVMFDKKAGTEKMVELIREAGKNGAELIVFPELIIPCYPYGMTFGYTVGSRDKVGRLDWKRYYDNSLCVPGPETELLGQAAKVRCPAPATEWFGSWPRSPTARLTWVPALQ